MQLACLDHRVNQVHQDVLDLVGKMVKEVNLERQVKQVGKEKEGFQVWQVHQVSLERKGILGLEEMSDLKELQVHRDSQDQEESQV